MLYDWENASRLAFSARGYATVEGGAVMLGDKPVQGVNVLKTAADVALQRTDGRFIILSRPNANIHDLALFAGYFAHLYGRTTKVSTSQGIFPLDPYAHISPGTVPNPEKVYRRFRFVGTGELDTYFDHVPTLNTQLHAAQLAIGLVERHESLRMTRDVLGWRKHLDGLSDNDPLGE